jgi:hypothetical protein
VFGEGRAGIDANVPPRLSAAGRYFSLGCFDCSQYFATTDGIGLAFLAKHKSARGSLQQLHAKTIFKS